MMSDTASANKEAEKSKKGKIDWVYVRWVAVELLKAFWSLIKYIGLIFYMIFIFLYRLFSALAKG